MYAISYSWKGVLYFLIMILGNAAGSILFDGLIKLIIKCGIINNNKSNNNLID
jgi:hypothetical protein